MKCGEMQNMEETQRIEQMKGTKPVTLRQYRNSVGPRFAKHIAKRTII